MDSKVYHLGCTNPHPLKIDLFTTIMSSSMFYKSRNECWLWRISVAKFNPQQATDFYKMNLFEYPTGLYLVLFHCSFITFYFSFFFLIVSSSVAIGFIDRTWGKAPLVTDGWLKSWAEIKQEKSCRAERGN